LRHHRLSAADSLFRVLDNPGSSLLTWLVIGIALALPVGLSITLDNVDRLSANWQSPSQISLFLAQSADEQAAVELATRIQARADVQRATVVSREQALAEFRETSGFGDVLDSLRDNPLPNLVLVSPVEGVAGDGLTGLQADLQSHEAVEEAVLDMAWLQRLNQLMALGRRAVLAVGGMLILGVLLILGNTIRLAIESRRDEIVIVKLVGGSNGFVRRPFLYTGLWYGVGGGLLAALVVGVALWFLGEPVSRLTQLYDSRFELRGLGLMGSLNLVIMGGVLGLAGAWLAVGRHLKSVEPR
jgi:cell division transport system permease protein